VQIYNNAFYWNPAANAPAFSADDAVYSGNGPRFFQKGNEERTAGRLAKARRFAAPGLITSR
jgi:hypothetical protein